MDARRSRLRTRGGTRVSRMCVSLAGQWRVLFPSPTTTQSHRLQAQAQAGPGNHVSDEVTVDRPQTMADEHLLSKCPSKEDPGPWAPHADTLLLAFVGSVDGMCAS